MKKRNDLKEFEEQSTALKNLGAIQSYEFIYSSKKLKVLPTQPQLF